MNEKKYRFIYGPVSSWRLGSSLGIDPISQEGKVCTFDCVYCQLGRTKVFSDKRRVFVPEEEVVREIGTLSSVPVDFITFSGAGEPTLAKNLGAMIRAIKKIRGEKVAVITNSSLLDREDVREDLSFADFVLAKLDVCSDDLFRKINRPMGDIQFDAMVNALREFKAAYSGRLALQIMLMPANEKYAVRIALLSKEISLDEIQINTPLRPCGAEPLSETDLAEIKRCFEDVCDQRISIIGVYDGHQKKVASISGSDTLKRRGKT